MKQPLDKYLTQNGLIATRNQAESYIKLGLVKVDGKVINKSNYFVNEESEVLINTPQYVSRAGLKLASAIKHFVIDFSDKVVLDVGSSTGGFTDFALKNGAKKVIAVEAGKDQLHASLRSNPKIELHEQTDIRDITATASLVDIVVIDVSFISLREILPKVASLVSAKTLIITLFKPQFEAGGDLKNDGIIKNHRIRRDLMRNFELWLKTNKFIILNQIDSPVFGTKGNEERFYLIKKESEVA